MSNFALILLCFGLLVLVALAMLIGAMGRRIRDDYRHGRGQRRKTYQRLTLTFAGLAAYSIFHVGVLHHEWIPALGFALFAAAMCATFWLNKPRPS
ncbi:hypothetical protein [Sphingomonas sp. URHD0057]|uniref:hypothetical protein n=1 Tax=Sphingomonas sp. URHD0057 TaxID=1380389 RepID=UPI00048BC0E6|nr:hypothetical protein [Sphingomonas sp. URHD0057]